jgi:hypothetical protein
MFMHVRLHSDGKPLSLINTMMVCACAGHAVLAKLVG